ncbi:Prenylcysteine oxidase [Trichoderma citrinoviride]|uniref:Prenylcysteine oxidase n=1 Tax=Trichoderma citrinoviride TaxID=58853 RepID=A0A2T4AYC0_9HYPO|nr:Prenylcysteine oxidase [Trichoderma citrinoviride]PTB61978.1 Prenylcysteine oxidase [Trichoderma citrinoviride]
MRLQLGPALVAWLALGGEAAAEGEATTETKGVKNVAIIGAGAAGSSAAYYLCQYADEADVKVNITIFEKTDRIGGRTLTVNAYDDAAHPIELGASIFVSVNHILYNGTRNFNLSTGANYREASSADDITAIWDGESFVYETTDGTAWWWDAGKLWWRYGMSPYRAVSLVKDVVGKFLKLYEGPYFPFRSLTARAYELGLVGVTAVTGEQFLKQHKIDEAFSRHIIQAATRVNYASNLAYIHGLETMVRPTRSLLYVSFATDGAMSVTGGNWHIFENMVKNSGAAILRNTTVSSIRFAKGETSSSAPKYEISTSSASAEPELVDTTFDDVIIASPWQFSNIEAGEGVLKHKIEEIPYTKLHVTLFASPFKLHPAFFGLPPGSKAPSNVYTTLAKDEEPKVGADGVGKTGFYSVSTLRTAVNPKANRTEFVYKIFSPKPVTPQFLSDLLGVQVPETFTGPATTTETDGSDGLVEPISWYYPHWFYSYPIELPRVTFQDPILGSGLYYTSGIESFISTMETSALMGMNVARLIVDDAAGVEREAVPGAVSEEDFLLGMVKVDMVVEEPGEL